VPSRGRLIAGALIVAVLLAAGGFLVGRLGTPGSAAPASESAAAGFLRDMQVHHAQAVDMAMTIRDISDDPELRRLAYDIALGQAGQAGQMYGLLDSWNLPQASALPPMAWMSQPVIDGSDDGAHAAMGPATGVMPGMASDAQLAELRSATGAEAERLFLTLMIAHHRGGIEMAEAVLARTRVPQVVALATGIIAAQSSDIDAMQAMLDARSP
jgi:uncharacterized protein (DUF305 family)